MIKSKVSKTIYKNLIKPILFLQDAEKVHDKTSTIGEVLGTYSFTKDMLSKTFSYKENPILKQTIDGITFGNPIGLSAGFDYDGHMSEVLKSIGFGFNTIGTVTAKPYDGNTKPRLARLPLSKSLLINKGFKSDGVEKVKERLKSKNLKTTPTGVSIGSSNLPEINTISKAIDDYLITFKSLLNEDYIKYFELNISCPNASMSESFANSQNFNELTKEVMKLKTDKPIYVKMANGISTEVSLDLMRIGIENSMSGFIFSNLVKDRSNKYFNKTEIEKIKKLKGNFSGKPTEENSLKLITSAYKRYGNNTTIIGCGGIFSAQDAYKKIKAGASLVQLITGIIYEGPQLIEEINEDLVRLLRKNRYETIKEVMGNK